jgi:anti-anti-sigma regulatory factor
MSLEALSALYPFHVAADLELRICSVGPSLAKICPSVTPERRAAECLRLARPRAAMEIAALRSKQRTLVLVETLSERVALRGQIVVDEAQGLVLFAVAPRVLEAADISALGLSLHDFGPSDPMADFLLLLQTKESILGDALRLNEELGLRQVELEGAREALLAEVEERKRAEEELRRTNEELTQKLETIEEQRRTLVQLSTPSLHVWEGVVALPIVGRLDEERGARLSEALLAAVTRHGARVAIVDLTGVDAVLDGAVERLLDAVRAVELVGGLCLVSGVSPLLARALIASGADVLRVPFFASLRAALAHVLAARRRRGAF